MSRKIITMKCNQCQKKVSRYASWMQTNHIFCNSKCMYAFERGENSVMWKGGKTKSSGYIRIYHPSHPRASGRYVSEHRLIMENILGRFLNDDEVVHHKNGNKIDNTIKNLELTTKSQHSKYHNLCRKVNQNMREKARMNALKRLRNKKGQFILKKKRCKNGKKTSIWWICSKFQREKRNNGGYFWFKTYFSSRDDKTALGLCEKAWSRS